MEFEYKNKWHAISKVNINVDLVKSEPSSKIFMLKS